MPTPPRRKRRARPACSCSAPSTARRRAVPVALVERIEDVGADAIGFSAGRLRVSIGDRILPLAGCAAAPAEGKLRILRLTDGASEIAYGFAEVIDIRALALELQPAPAPGEVAGVALIDGAQVEMLDPHWLFAQHGDAAHEETARPVCALPDGDPWIDNMLRPLIEGLGYRIARAARGGRHRHRPRGGRGPRQRPCRAHPRVRPKGEGIYRYDRAALIGALSAAKGRADG